MEVLANLMMLACCLAVSALIAFWIYLAITDEKKPEPKPTSSRTTA